MANQISQIIKMSPAFLQRLIDTRPSYAHSQFLSQIRFELPRHHPRYAARHENVPVRFNLNFNLPAGAMHRELTVYMPQLVCGARRRATAAPRRQRVSRASFPNLNLNVPRSMTFNSCTLILFGNSG